MGTDPGGYPCCFFYRELFFRLLYSVRILKKQGLYDILFLKNEKKGCETGENINQSEIWAAHDD